jgi:S1-C subfamily serine protease
MTAIHYRSRSLWIGVTGWLLAAACTVAEPAAGVDVPELHRLQDMLSAVADEARPSVVAIQAWRSSALVRLSGNDPAEPSRQEHLGVPGRDGRGNQNRGDFDNETRLVSLGSGIVLHAQGLILTNEHVVRGSIPHDIVCRLPDGRAFRVRDVTSDPRRDLAVLAIDADDLTPARLGDAQYVRQGHLAIVLGNPHGTASLDEGRPAMSFGVISALGRSLTAQLNTSGHERYYGNLIQTDAPIHPGNSGGPLLNIRGEVVGVSTAVATVDGSSRSMGYAIPLDQRTREIINRLAQGEEVDYGFLGVALRSATEDDWLACGPQANTPGYAFYGGAVVTFIEPGTPAADAFLEAGDVLVAIDGRHVQSVDDVLQRIGEATIGVRLDLTICRRGHRLVVPVSPARRKMPAPDTMTWRGATLAYPDWEVCRRFRLPVDVRGLVVTTVQAGSAAERAGLEAGQVVGRIGHLSAGSIRKLSLFIEELTGPVTVTGSGSPAREWVVPESF